MKRDMDLLRDLLLISEAEAISGYGVSVAPDRFPSKDFRELYGHVGLLRDAGWVYDRKGEIGGGRFHLPDLTMKGHDYLDTVRDDELWRKSKELSSKAGGYTMELLRDIAFGFIKTQVKKLSGIEV
jgi:hypothetical protein